MNAAYILNWFTEGGSNIQDGHQSQQTIKNTKFSVVVAESFPTYSEQYNIASGLIAFSYLPLPQSVT